MMPETGTPVPATALSGGQAFGASSLLVVGEARMPSPFPSPSSGFMFAVVDLSSLEIVAKAAPVGTNNSTVPPEIEAYAGREGFFLFFIAANMVTAYLPQGALYTFLKSTGSGAMLENLEQAVGQLGTGTVGVYSYILAGTLDSGDLPGFEAMSLTDFSTLPMQFVPITVGGQTTYAPSQYSTA